LGLSATPSPTNTVVVKVTNVPDAPTQGPVTINALEDTVLTFNTNSFASGYNVAHVDGSEARSAVSYTFETLPSLGTLKLSGAALTANQVVPVASFGNLTFTPALNQSGTATFRVSVSDGLLSSGTGTNAATITLVISGENDAPFAVAQAVSTLEDTVLPITLNGTDPDGNTLTFSIVSGPTKGSLSGTPPTISYTPGANFSGSDSFTFKVNDGTDNSAVARVDINVTNLNDIPSFTIPMTLKPGGDKAAWDLLAGSLGSWSGVAVSSNGSVVVASSGTDLAISTDGGVTRTNATGVPGGGGYNAVAGSADGTKLLVARGTGLHTYSGGTWFTPSAATSGLPAVSWVAVA